MAKDLVAAARKRVDAANKAHYALLKDQEKVREQMRENAVELADAIDELAAAEAETRGTGGQTAEVGTATEDAGAGA